LPATATKQAFVSLIMINYNGYSKLGDLLDACIASVLSTDYPSFELIFLDNASTDNSVDHVNETFSDCRLKVLPSNRNLGYAEGANYALKFAHGDIIGVLNNDILLPHGWLRDLLETFRLDSKIKVVCPKLLFIENPERINSCGGQINVLLVAWDKFLDEQDASHPAKIERVFSPAGAIFLMTRDLIQQLDGKIFDDDYFAYYEDVDLGWRTNLLGCKVVCNSNVVAYHKHGGSFGDVTPTKFFLFRRNALRTGIKNGDKRLVLLMLPVWLASTIVAAHMYYRATHVPGFLKAGLRVIIDVFVGLKKTWIKRTLFERVSETSEGISELFSDTLLVNRASLRNKICVIFLNRLLKFRFRSAYSITKESVYSFARPYRTTSKLDIHSLGNVIRQLGNERIISIPTISQVLQRPNEVSGQ
jgi:GT2 family glycosyltransferase